jgi:hypothetical protein
MSFDIARTPTLEAVATDDEQLLMQDLRKRMEEAVAQAELLPEVTAALAAQAAAAEQFARLRKAERALTEQSRHERESIAAMSEALLGAVIESAGAGAKPPMKKLAELAAMEDQARFASRAIRRIVEHLLPVAEITSLREESFALMTKARAVEKIAQERAEKLLGQLKSAVSEEVVLPVDMSKGVAGALLQQAAELKRRAVQISGDADRMERQYMSSRREGSEW